MFAQWHVKDPGHSAKSAGGTLHLNTPEHAYTLDPSKSEWADYAVVQAESGNLSRNELTHNSSGNTQLQSSQLAEPLWTDPGLKSEISLRELISTLKKKAQAGNELSNILPKSSHARKKPPFISLTDCLEASTSKFQKYLIKTVDFLK